VKLEELHLHENLFDGPIPDSLLQCTRLKSLTLVKNCLEGVPLILIRSVNLPAKQETLERYLLNTRRVDVMDIHAHCLMFHGASTETSPSLRLFQGHNTLPSLTPLTFSFPVHTGALPEGLMSVLPLVTTPRSGADLPCQILPQRTYEEVQQLYGASLFNI
jgi:hypothetical protein